jgi:DNA-binding CsgD family transcriptional regulator
MRCKREHGAPPPKLAALISSDGDIAILSFELPLRGQQASLTLAESEIVPLLLAGRTNAEISAMRGTTPRTIANQVASVYRKLGVASRLELVASAATLHPVGHR